ncbi:MAG: hypothetical protein ACTSRU_21240 [Candidatus Hodarchaeales archaeon]
MSDRKAKYCFNCEEPIKKGCFCSKSCENQYKKEQEEENQLFELVLEDIQNV